MKRLSKKTRLKVFSLAAVALFVLLTVTPEITNAGLFDVIPSVADLVTGIIRTVANVLSYIGGIFFTLAGMLTNFMLYLNLNVLSDSNSLVHIGWRIVRDLANLGFVLVIIVIAFATILRFEQYGVSKLLPKLIAAAIIVNFSFAIAAAFINFSHVITNFFAARAIPNNPSDIAASLANAFGPQRFFIDTNPLPPNPDEESGGTGFGTAVLISITGLVFIIVFTFLGALVLLAFAFMLLVRYLYLTFLVILAPLVWLFWVIPKLEGMFGKWWNSFLRWVFFAPASMFFLYLSLVSVQKLGETNFEFLKGSGTFSGSLQNIMIQGAQMFVLGGILLGGLIIAQKMGIYGASGALAIADKAKGAVAGWAGRKAANVGRKALTTGADKEGKTGLERLGAKYGRIPIVGRLATGLSGLSTRSKVALKSQLDDRKKAYAERTGEDAAAIASRRVTVPDEELAAAGLRAAEKGKWDNITDGGQERVVAALKRMNAGEQLLAYQPTLAQNFGKTIEEAMAKYVQDATKLLPEALGKDEISRSLKNTHISQLGNNGTIEQKQKVVVSLETQLGGKNGTMLTQFNNLTSAMDAARYSGDKAAIDRAKNDLKAFRNQLRTANKDQATSLERYERILGDNNWQDVL